MKRKCIDCGHEDEITNFPQYSNKGNKYYRTRCHQCHRKANSSYAKNNRKKKNEYSRAYYAANKEAARAYQIQKMEKRYDKFYDAVYKGKCCERCGFDDVRALELHHKDPENKSFTIGREVRSIAWDKLMEEVAKCEIVCANCHKIEHSGKHRSSWLGEDK